MPSEASRALVRICANYVRLFTAVALGLWTVRLLIQGAGTDAFGLISLIGSTVGIAHMFQQIVRYTLIREIGSAYHAGDDDAFRRTFSSALLLVIFVAAAVAIIYAIIWLVVPVLQISDELQHGARWLVVAKGFETGALVLLAPYLNLYVIAERMVLHNLWLFLERFTKFVGAVAIIVLAIDDPGRAVVLYGFTSALLYIVVMIIGAAIMLAGDRRLVPDPRRISTSTLGAIVHMGKWNVAVLLAAFFHLRVAQIIMNVFFGLVFNAMFGLAVNLAGYVRMLTQGMTEGIDAVSVRLAAGQRHRGVARLLHHATRLHAFVAFPAGAVVFVLAEPAFSVWVGGRLDPQHIPTTALIMRALVVGLTARAISDGWVRILYGAGYVRHYAGWFLLGGVANPILSLLVLLVLPSAFLAPALVYSVILTGVNFLLIPVIGARCLSIRYVDFFAPLARPALVTAICLAPLLLAEALIDTWSIWSLGAVGVLIAALYGALSWFLVVLPDERQRILTALRRLARDRTLRPPRPTHAPAPVPPAPADDPNPRPTTSSTAPASPQAQAIHHPEPD